jgi:hypothetical protein
MKITPNHTNFCFANPDFTCIFLLITEKQNSAGKNAAFGFTRSLITLNDLIREKGQEEEYKPPGRTKVHEEPYFLVFFFLRAPSSPTC